MKTIKLIITIFTFLFMQSIYPQQSNVNWAGWKYLMGTWQGNDNGQPGNGSGSFTFKTDLDGNILVRKSHTEFPATKTRAAFAHDDMLIIYPDTSGTPAKAIYFDNEGHTINYDIDYDNNSIILTSPIIKGTIRFRFSYVPIDNNNVNVKFEMAMPDNPDYFKTYLEGKATKNT